MFRNITWFSSVQWIHLSATEAEKMGTQVELLLECLNHIKAPMSFKFLNFNGKKPEVMLFSRSSSYHILLWTWDS